MIEIAQVWACRLVFMHSCRLCYAKPPVLLASVATKIFPSPLYLTICLTISLSVSLTLFLCPLSLSFRLSVAEWLSPLCSGPVWTGPVVHSNRSPQISMALLLVGFNCAIHSLLMVALAVACGPCSRVSWTDYVSNSRSDCSIARLTQTTSWVGWM